MGGEKYVGGDDHLETMFQAAIDARRALPRGKTQLHPEHEARYQEWRAREEAQRGHPIESDDYDMRGFWAENGGPVVTKAPFVMAGTNGEAHFNDAHKLPNHPTFSDEALRSSQMGGSGPQGGHWTEATYTPSPASLADQIPAHEKEALVKYFEETEPDVALRMPPVDEWNAKRLRDQRNVKK